MKITVKLTIINDEKFFGPGTLELLKNVVKTGSLLTAAEEMGLSYSKARKMIKTFRLETGEKAIISQAGGAGGGSGILSPPGGSVRSHQDPWPPGGGVSQSRLGGCAGAGLLPG